MSRSRHPEVRATLAARGRWPDVDGQDEKEDP